MSFGNDLRASAVVMTPMDLQRRLLPSMSALTAFEAAARTGSFTAAAGELSLTQGAVSRQIKALEDQIGTPLFIRKGQRVTLTPTGALYAEPIRDALRQIAAATVRTIAAPKGGELHLAILPTFGTRWLVPRLPAFQAAHPQVTIHFTTKLAPFDFRTHDLDAAIHYGLGDWPDAVCDHLLDEEVLPVCAPSFLKAHPIADPADLIALPLLHTSTRPDAWAGLGVALLPTLLVRGELADGALVPAIDRPHRSARAYYLVHPRNKANHPPLAAFRRWLLDAAREKRDPVTPP